MSIFDQGAAASKEASEASGGGFARDFDYFNLKNGESAFLRFMTDAFIDPRYPHVGGWIPVMQHQSLPTCPRPAWHSTGERTKDKNWPGRMKCVCRNTMVGPEGDKKPLWPMLPDADEGDCWVCKNRRSEKGGQLRGTARSWALAILREQVQQPDGSFKFITKTHEIEREVNGEKKMVVEPIIVVVNQAYSNFFKQLEGSAEAFGTNTILDRDFKVTRVGEQLATDYIIVPMNQDPLDPADLNKGYLDLRIPEHYAAFNTGVKLEDIVTGQASVEYQRRWFDPDYTPPVKEESEGGGNTAPAAEQAKPAGDLDPASLAEMQARLTGYGAPAAAPAAQPAAAPAAVPGQAVPGQATIPGQAVPGAATIPGQAIPPTGAVPVT